MKAGRPNIFEYSNYRDFLKDVFATLKKENPKFSYRVFAKLAGFKSSSVLKNVIDNKRNIAHYNIDVYAKALGLNIEETYYFRNLVLLNQSSSPTEKELYAEAILKSRSYKRIRPLAESKFNFYARWYYAVIWEIIGLPNFREDHPWIANKLTPSISETEVKTAFEELEKLGLIERDENGKIRKSSANIATADEVSSVAISSWHKNMIKKASDSIDLISREERDISSVTLLMSKSMTKKIKEKIGQFRKEIVEMQKIDTAGGDSVYQLNLQLFPLFDSGDGGKK